MQDTDFNLVNCYFTCIIIIIVDFLSVLFYFLYDSLLGYFGCHMYVNFLVMFNISSRDQSKLSFSSLIIFSLYSFSITRILSLKSTYLPDFKHDSHLLAI